ncbi:chromo shadow domain protein [Cooperia oncophora]
MGRDKRKEEDEDSGDGFPLEESTWEPEENVACHELIAEFERKRNKSSEYGSFFFYVEKKEPQTAPSEKRDEKQLHRIIGLTDAPGELHFLIKWKDHTADLVPAKEANVKYPQEVIRFYEERLKMQNR